MLRVFNNNLIPIAKKINTKFLFNCGKKSILFNLVLVSDNVKYVRANSEIAVV
ncbi:MAG: hypothetical protein J6M39_04730 [Lachnospiraceae bacterium]|nr:hypothetical protein [Lachnospiraceae bacterium]